MSRGPATLVAVAVNLSIVAGIGYKAFTDSPGNARGWLFVALLLGCPLLNLLGLTGVAGRAATAVATLLNGAAALAWGAMIALMLVWPLGNQPKGIELALLVASWLALVLTEVLLVRDLREPRTGADF